MTSICLDSVLDLAAAAPLRALLLEHRERDVDIDASKVERLGGLCLQVLLSARSTWAESGKSFRLKNLSEACREALRLAQAAAALGVE